MSTHFSHDLFHLIKMLNFFYSPPYSPFLNPIEEFFGVLKHYISRTVNDTRIQLLTSLHKAVKEISEKSFVGF